MADKLTPILVDALKQALTEPGEQRLYKSGKLDGLFANKSGSNAEAAAQAVRDGLLEVVRTEAKGKTTTEWVKLTPRGVEYLHAQESPLETLQELQAILQLTREGVPMWLAEMRHQLQTLGNRLAEEAEKWSHRLDALSSQIREALHRAELIGPAIPDGLGADAEWAKQALSYLEHRRKSGAATNCPLPELFAALHDKDPELSVISFHDRLRRLRDHKALRLLPFSGTAGDIPEPEYALLDGTNLLYFAAEEGAA